MVKTHPQAGARGVCTHPAHRTVKPWSNHVWGPPDGQPPLQCKHCWGTQGRGAVVPPGVTCPPPLGRPVTVVTPMSQLLLLSTPCGISRGCHCCVPHCWLLPAVCRGSRSVATTLAWVGGRQQQRHVVLLLLLLLHPALCSAAIKEGLPTCPVVFADGGVPPAAPCAGPC